MSVPRSPAGEGGWLAGRIEQIGAPESGGPGALGRRSPDPRTPGSPDPNTHENPQPQNPTMALPRHRARRDVRGFVLALPVADPNGRRRGLSLHRQRRPFGSATGRAKTN